MIQDEQKLAQELLNRRNARREMVHWSRLCGFEPAQHHRLLISKLEAVVRGEIKRLAIFMPPGSAKSTYSSVLFPPWFLAQRPNSSILTASHSADLATQFGRRARNLIVDHELILRYGLRKDSQAADEWATTNGGVFFCAGVGGRIAGRRADLGLIDDPVGSKEDAYSKVIRDATWNWYKFDFRTRLKPGASVVLVQTRWHEEDLAGKLLMEEPGEWEVINLPMLAKDTDVLGRAPGELLWKDYFTPQIVSDAKKDPMLFSALYQQDPTPEDGDYFRRSWVEDNAYDSHELPNPSDLTFYAASDHAVSEKERADFTCLVPVGVDCHNTIWVLPEVFWEKCDTLTSVNAMLLLMGKRSFRTWWAEADKIGKSIGPFLKQEMRKRGTFCYIEEVHPSKDKQTRAQSIRGRFQLNSVRLPRFAPWYPRAVEQMMKFPAGMHDDFVDPLAHIGLGLDKMLMGRKPPIPVDTSIYLNDIPLTVKWLKDSDRQVRRKKELLLQDA